MRALKYGLAGAGLLLVAGLIVAAFTRPAPTLSVVQRNGELVCHLVNRNGSPLRQRDPEMYADWRFSWTTNSAEHPVHPLGLDEPFEVHQAIPMGATHVMVGAELVSPTLVGRIAGHLDPVWRNRLFDPWASYFSRKDLTISLDLAPVAPPTR